MRFKANFVTKFVRCGFCYPVNFTNFRERAREFPRSSTYFWDKPRTVCMYVCQHIQTSSSLKPLGRLKPNFMWNPYGMGERSFVQTVQVTWPGWPPCPYRVKSFKNFLLRNQTADYLECWYAASGAKVLSSLLKWWPWPILRQGQICFHSLLYRKRFKL